jgi:SHS2 domain-containing protein
VEIEIAEASPTHLVAHGRGASLADASSQVKAATFHGLRIRDLSHGLEAEVILDV